MEAHDVMQTYLFTAPFEGLSYYSLPVSFERLNARFGDDLPDIEHVEGPRGAM